MTPEEFTPEELEHKQDLLRASRGGLCSICDFAKLIKSSRESVFVMCSHPDLPKYQGQPVQECAMFQTKA